MDPSSKWTFTLGGWVGGICNGVSPEAKVEGGIEMGPENQLGLANSGLLLLKLDSENRPPPHQDGTLPHGVCKVGFGVLPGGSVKTKIRLTPTYSFSLIPVPPFLIF